MDTSYHRAMVAAYDSERVEPGSRKVTVTLPARDLDQAMKISGKGLTETLRIVLRAYVHAWACDEFLKLRGQIHITDEDARWMMGKDDDDE